VQVDFAGSADSMQKNLDLEFARNRERYNSSSGACKRSKRSRSCRRHWHRASGESGISRERVLEQGGVYYPDTLVGTDSHTTMINGLGIVAGAWWH